jgi:AAA domain, putative AbiEii toxin, Type IV TA system
VLLLGYGATRLLPRGKTQAQPSGAVTRVDNLFDPFAPLADAHGWLLGLDDESFEHVARRLRKLLFLKPRTKFDRENGRIEVSGIPLEQLSDGNQSVLALAVDIIAVMFTRWPALEAAEGIVLVDELGAHLHPRWRMRIVTSLREVFPRVQFLVSTHDPLCLSGLKNGEVVVMQRDARGASRALVDVPPVEGLRVDQLLTSEFFGLYSTIDPSLDRLFDEFYFLKAKPKRTKTDDERLAELEKVLDGKQQLGVTRRDRIVLAAADDYLAKERRTVDPGERLALKEETKDKIKAVWERVAAGRPA